MFWLPLLALAWVAAVGSCARLVRAATAVAAVDDHAPDVPPYDAELTLHEAAFLCGGPERVADLTLLTMHADRRLMLAHTGWTTVVTPHGHNGLERAAIAAAGPDGQSRTAVVRAGVAAAETVRALADRLIASGLAVPAHLQHAVRHGVRAVRNATALILALGAVVGFVLPQDPAETTPAVLWFTLPLLLTLGCLAVARIEVHPYTQWASTAGRIRLRAMEADGPEDAHRALLTAVAVSGARAIPDPELRTALTGAR
ncbi:membrane protein [Streptomyces spiroverticillatus]|uniref:Membrane protein n=1 Tax=Streptomyces finlayi TaxID=67296 RepID=A0A918WVF6_9ACTN|nr:TIGR04222 domain-containing membrane protein [Streptomyces finlayi]GHA02937.1 membrane protein [Streptomyces spiroverticillatus]GHC87163.1 membrane protein [Streptomyces finlayi]